MQACRLLSHSVDVTPLQAATEWRDGRNGRMAEWQEWRTDWSNGGNGRMAEIATYVLFTVHTDDTDDDTLIFYSIDPRYYRTLSRNFTLNT